MDASHQMWSVSALPTLDRDTDTPISHQLDTTYDITSTSGRHSHYNDIYVRWALLKQHPVGITNTATSTSSRHYQSDNIYIREALVTQLHLHPVGITNTATSAIWWGVY